MYKKICIKLNALAGIVHFMDVNNKRSIMEDFTESQFGYPPLKCMFHGRQSENKINHFIKIFSITIKIYLRSIKHKENKCQLAGIGLE